jgi:hypothetical protein
LNLFTVHGHGISVLWPTGLFTKGRCHMGAISFRQPGGLFPIKSFLAYPPIDTFGGRLFYKKGKLTNDLILL